VASASKPHTPEGVKHRHAPTKTPGIYTSSNGKPGGLRWEVKYTDPATGKQAWSSVFKRRQDALSFQAEVRGKVDKGTVIGNPSMTFRALVAEWKVVRDARVSEGTASSQDMHLRVHILPVLGNRKVRDISRATVLRWQAGIKRKDGRVGPPAPSTVNLIRATLSSVLDHAVAAGVIAVNPCKTLARGEKPKGEQKEKTILADGDLDKLLRAVGRRTWMADMIQVALGQALRLGEVAGLDWKDVDFETNRLNVARSVSKKTGAIGVPKGGRAATIPLTPSTRKVLARLHPRRSSGYRPGVRQRRPGGRWIPPSLDHRARLRRRVPALGHRDARARDALAPAHRHLASGEQPGGAAIEGAAVRATLIHHHHLAVRSRHRDAGG
jgi:integrase